MLTLARWMTLLFVIFISVAVAQAQATRTWVSGVGDDANPCSRTAPCKTFAGAISKTAASGEIDALDPGGFGAVTITKAITIDGGPGVAGVLVSGANGIVVAAGINDVVTLRNLDINGSGPLIVSLSGVQFNSGAGLHIENSTIYGFATAGINFAPTGTSFLSVTRTIVRDNAGGGLLVIPGSSGAANITVVDSHFDHNQFGIRAQDRAEVSVRGSTAAFNIGNGFLAVSTSAPVEMVLDNCLSGSNQSSGIWSKGPAATVYMANTSVTHNSNGVTSISGGSILSFGNNRIMSNSTNGGPTSVVSQQ